VSLIVSIYRVTASPETEWVDPALPSPRNELFGFETCRQSLWGSDVVRRLGCDLLPTLGDGHDIQAEGGAIDRLEREARLLLDHVSDVAHEVAYAADLIAFRLENLLAAIAYVRRMPLGSPGNYIG
jgi:hypothetical protein